MDNTNSNNRNISSPNIPAAVTVTPKQCLQHRRRITPSRRLSAPFKSPLMPKATPDTSSVKEAVSLEVLEEQMTELRKKESHLDEEIKQLLDDGYSEEELQTHIDKMHEYNEIKDVAQMLLGQIAIKEGVTTRQLYDRYGLDVND